NDIGTFKNGVQALGNGQDGVELLSNNSLVADNVISGNGASGVLLQGSSNVIRGNKIGANILGNAAVPNQHDGIFIAIVTGPGGNLVGGTSAGDGNLISGNGWNGIAITGPASAANLIAGNSIGTNA